jgi:hypothetical protein
LPRGIRCARVSHMSDQLLQLGDWVRTEFGITGRVILINRMTAFVGIENESHCYTVACLLSELIKTQRPATKPDR